MQPTGNNLRKRQVKVPQLQLPREHRFARAATLRVDPYVRCVVLLLIGRMYWLTHCVLAP